MIFLTLNTQKRFRKVSKQKYWNKKVNITLLQVYTQTKKRNRMLKYHVVMGFTTLIIAPLLN